MAGFFTKLFGSGQSMEATGADGQTTKVIDETTATVAASQAVTAAAREYGYFTEENSADVVVERNAASQNERLKEVMDSVTRHLHAAVKEIEPTQEEWMQAIQFLTKTGHKSDDWRQEYILLSDVLGVSMLVDAVNNRKTEGGTETTVLGPFHIDDAPERANGDDICLDQKGQPMVVRGKVSTVDGTPIVGAKLDVWQANDEGFYDVQQKGIQPDYNLRGVFRSEGDGTYWFRGVKPQHYAIPHDGPVGQLLSDLGRHPHRPAHLHFIVSADGYKDVTTHIFVPDDPYIDSDAVFGVKESLLADFVLVDDEARAKELGVTNPFYDVEFDFILEREGARKSSANGAANGVAKAAPQSAPAAAKPQANGTMSDIERQDEEARASALALQQRQLTADPDTLRLMLTEARTHYGWQERAVGERTLRELYDIAKMGPTSMNQQPIRVIFVQSQEAKERLATCLNEPNVPKMMSAPVTAIIAYDTAFFEDLPRIFPPNPNAKDIFANNPQAAQVNAFRNGTLQGAYFMLAARAVGLDVGGMSGFDNAKVDEAFFSGTTLKSNFLCNLGYADTSKIFRRLPRRTFDESCEILGELPQYSDGPVAAAAALGSNGMSEPKITKHDVLEASKGMLQKQLYLVLTTPTNGMGPVMANLEEHLKFQVKLEADGIMFGAGPFWADNEADWNGEGMVIIRADSLAHAKEIAATDPMHSSGARSFTVRPWLLNEGTLTVKIDYSTGGREVI